MRRRLALVIALAAGLPAIMLSYLGLRSVDADRQALLALRQERLRQAAREASTTIEDALAARAEAVLAGLGPARLAERVRAALAAPGESARALEAIERELEVAQQREPLLRTTIVIEPERARLVLPRAASEAQGAPAAPTRADPLRRLLDAQAPGSELREAIARFEARADLEGRLAEAIRASSRGELSPPDATALLAELALDPTDAELAARARLALARALVRANEPLAALAQLDIVSLVDPALTTRHGLSIAAAARLAAGELRLEGRRERRRGAESLATLCEEVVAGRLPVPLSEARMLLERSLRAVSAASWPDVTARVGGLAETLERRAREALRARELAQAALADVVAAVRVSPPGPGETGMLAVLPRRTPGPGGAGAAPRLVAFRRLPNELDPASAVGSSSEQAAARAAGALAGLREPLAGSPPGETGALVIAVEIDLDRALEQVCQPWLAAIASDRGLALTIELPDGSPVSSSEQGGPLARAPAGRTPEAALVARARFERLLPFWAVSARLGPDDLDGQRARRRLAGQVALVVLLLGLLAAGATWSYRALSQSLELAELKAELVANVSHELRTPLASIKLYVDMLRSGRARTEERRASYLETLWQETTRLEGLIDGLLAFARHGDAGHASPRERLSASAVALTALDEVRPQLSAEGFEVEVEAEGEALAQAADSGEEPALPHAPDEPPRAPAPCVMVDRVALVQAVKNLLQNSIKYSPPERRFVRLEVRAADGGVVIEVTDRGVGIPADERKRLFERFYRGEAARTLARPGAGLGLALVERVAVDHGGKVSVRSVPGEGSTFTMWLPAAPPR